MIKKYEEIIETEESCHAQSIEETLRRNKIGTLVDRQNNFFN